MQTNECPKCQSELRWQREGYHCDFCQIDFKKMAYCPDCSKEMEKLNACGAPSYFCHDCNELKSKSRAKTNFVEVNLS